MFFAKQADTPEVLLALLLFQSPEVLIFIKLLELLTLGERNQYLKTKLTEHNLYYLYLFC